MQDQEEVVLYILFLFWNQDNRSLTVQLPSSLLLYQSLIFYLSFFTMASQLNCFKCRLIIRTKQQKLDCSNCKNWFHRVLCSGISTQDWKENSATHEDWISLLRLFIINSTNRSFFFIFICLCCSWFFYCCF